MSIKEAAVIVGRLVKAGMPYKDALRHVVLVADIDFSPALPGASRGLIWGRN